MVSTLQNVHSRPWKLACEGSWDIGHFLWVQGLIYVLSLSRHTVYNVMLFWTMLWGDTLYNELWEAFTNQFSIRIKIHWKFRFALIKILTKWSLLSFAQCDRCTSRGMCKSLLPYDGQQWNYAQTKQNFHQIWIVVDKSLLKCVPRPEIIWDCGDMAWEFMLWNHQQLDCLFNSLFVLTANKTSKLHITRPWFGESIYHQWIPLTQGQ